MFDHIGIGVSDLRASKRFYLEALAPLGQGRKPSFWLGASEAKPQPLHIAFAADTRAQVDEFYRKALAAGGKDNGPPGIRAHYHADYYAAFVIGPDGHNIEVVCHRPAG